MELKKFVGILDALVMIIIKILAFCKNQKAKIISCAVVLLIGLLGLEATVFAEDNYTSIAYKDELINRFYVQDEWPHREEYEITAEVIGGEGGTIRGVPEQVMDGSDSINKVSITPNGEYSVSSIRVYKGEEIDGTYAEDDTDGESVRGTRRGKTYTLNVFKEVSENIHIVVFLKRSEYVAEIIGVPTGLEEETNDAGQTVLHQKYESLEDAIFDAEWLNKKREDSNSEEPVTIQILTKDNGEIRVLVENNTITETNDVIIDLNGQKLTSQEENLPTLEVKPYCSLTIIDSSLEQTGIVENTVGVAIKSDIYSTLTLGNEPRPVSTSCPTIKGKTYGITRDEGSTLNFYDGQVIGETAQVAISGYTGNTHTPELYEVISIDQTPKQTAFLSLPRGIEAMIGTVKYETLELAFEAVENNPNANATTPVEIDVVAPSVTTEAPITLTQNKNVILDLNGNNITGTHNGYMFINNGTMEIKDSTSEIEEDYHYSELVANDENYYFTKVDNHLEANNSGIDSSTAKSYIKIDLSKESSDKIFRVNVNANISSEGNNDYGYIYVTETTDSPNLSSTTGRVLRTSGINCPTEYTYAALEGGKTYYLHLIYNKNGSKAAYLDNFQINDITLSEMIEGVPTNTQSVLEELINGKGTISNSSYQIIKNEANANLVISSGNINSSSRVTIDNYGSIEINGGKLYSTNRSIYGYTSEENTGVIVNGGIVIGTIADGNITINDQARLFAPQGGAVAAKTGTVIISGGTLNSVESYAVDELSYSNNPEVIINGGTLVGYGGIYMGEVTINDVTIYAPNGYAIKSNNPYIHDATIIAKYGITGTSSSASSLNIDNIKMNTTGAAISLACGTVNIYDADIVTNDVAISNIMNWDTQTPGIYNIYGGKYVSSSASEPTFYFRVGTINIYGGEIINTNSSGTAIHIYENSSSPNKPIVNIGKKNTEEDNEISTTIPTFKSAGTAIFSESENGEVNFYDGQFIGTPGNVIRGTINSIEPVNSENKPMCITIEEITEDEITLDRYYLAECDPVAKISQSSTDLDLSKVTENIDYIINDDDYYFFKLDTAVSVCSKSAGSTVTSIDLLKDVILIDTIEIEEGQNIKLDLDGYTITSFTSLGFKNEGTLDIENSEETGRVNVHGTVIQNYGTLVTKAYLDNVQDYKNRMARIE